MSTSETGETGAERGEDEAARRDDTSGMVDPHLIGEVESALEYALPEECQHEWEDLVFLAEGEGLACRACRTTWALGGDVQSQTIQLVWSSARGAIADLYDRVEALEGLVGPRLKVAACEACRRFVDTTNPLEGLEVGVGRWSCRRHVALVLGLRHDDERVLQRVSAWAMAQGMQSSRDLSRRWEWERLVAVAPRLAEVAGERDQWATAHRVDLDRRLAGVLKLDDEASLDEIALGVARLVDTEAPRTRTGVGFLVGTVAAAQEVLDGTHEEDPELEGLPGHERLWVEVHNRVVLPNPMARTRLILDLFSDLVKDGNPDGLGGDILAMLTHRIAEELLSPILKDET